MIEAAVPTRRALASVAILVAALAASSPAAARAESASGSAAEPAEIYALVVGYNGGQPGLADLHYADDDAARFAMFFAGMIGNGDGNGNGNGKDRPTHVWLLADLDQETTNSLRKAGLTPPPSRSPTRAALLAVIAEIRQQLASRPRRGEVVLYFVYAGHGLQGRILLKPDGALEAAITGRELRAALSDVPVDRTLMFLDACRSQSLFSERGARDVEIGPDLSAQVSDLERRADAVKIGVLTAAATGKPAGEVRSLQAGFFSYVLASGLAGAADADGDDIVSFGELAAFVAFNTERLTGQRPWFDPPGGDLSARAIDHRGRTNRLVFAAPAAARYVVEAASGRPVFAEAYKDRRRPLKLTLPPGRYHLRQIASADGPGGVVADVQLAPGQVLQVADSAWRADATPVVTRRDGEALATDDGAGGLALAFDNPFTTDVVSTLAAGYRAGREPSVVGGGHRDSLSVGVAMGRAPLGLGSVETSLAIGYRHRRGWGIFGVRGELGSSSHFGGGEEYRLARTGLLIESGARWLLGPRIEVALMGGVGLKTALRVAADTSGDLWGPALQAGANFAMHVTGPVFVGLELRYAVHWIAIDGARRASYDPTVGVAMGVGF